MIKTTAKLSVHAIHLFLRNSLITFSLLFGILFIWLTIGIRIDTLRVFNYYVEGLYIKLDKKLILLADKVTIPKPKSSPRVDKIDEVLERIKYGLTFFEHIELRNIDFKNNKVGIYYHENVLQIETKEYLIRGAVHREGSMLKGRIPMLYLKEKKITMHGTFSYDLSNEVLNVQGTYAFQQLSGKFRVKKVADEVYFSLNSKVFSNLETLVQSLEMKPSLRAWAVEKVQAKKYQINIFSGKGKIIDKHFTLNQESVKAKIDLWNVSIAFNAKLKPIWAEKLIIDYSHRLGLEFGLEKPTYLGKDLDGSTVSVKNLGQKNSTLHVNLKFNTRFDKEIQSLIKAYKVDIPILQKSGKVQASLDLVIGLKEKYFSLEADVNFSQGEVWIKTLKLPIVSGNIHYQDGQVLFHKLVLKNEYYSGAINGKLDLKNKILRASFDVAYIRIGEKNNRIIHIKNHKIPFVLKYGKVMTIDVPIWELGFKYQNKIATLTLNNLKKLSPYLSKILPIKEGGKAKLSTKDFKTYRFNARLNRSTCFLYDNNNACASIIEIEGKVTQNNIDFYAFDKRLYFNKSSSRIQINNLNIDLKKLLEQKEEIGENTQEKKSSKLLILGKHSHLRYDDYTLIMDSYDVEIKEDGSIFAIGSADGDIIKFTKKEHNISLEALRIKDKTLHALINFDGLQKGRYSLKKSGDPKGITHGEIIVEGGVMHGFKAYNNTLAFINTLPALATLQDPGYSDEGFTIKSGLVEYRMIKRDIILFDSIYIEGESATIKGRGTIDIKGKTIDMKLSISVARELGKVVSSIPLVGYILGGDEQGVTIGLSITGTLDKPKVNTTAGKDLLIYPLNVLKRTIEVPKKLLSQE